MVEPLSGQVVEANLITSSEVSPDISAPLPESSDVSLSASSEANPNNPAALAARYEVSDRTIQNWVKRLVTECKISDSQLRTQHGIEVEYSSYCIELLDQLIEYRQTHGPKKIGQWFSSLAHEQAAAPSQPSPPDSEASPASVSSGQLAIATGVVSGEIALATDRQQSMLDSAIERFTLQPTYLNGQQETNLVGIEVLIGAVDQATAINDQRESALQEREVTVEKSEQVLEVVRDRLKAEQKRSKNLNQQAAEIGEREQSVSELLGKLGISQQS